MRSHNLEQAATLTGRRHVILILVLAAVASSLLLNAHLVPAGDNSTYLVLGQSIALGSGYRMISDPRAPLMALYPPGYPLLVAMVLAVTGTAKVLLSAIVPVKVLSVLFFVASTAVTYELFRHRNRQIAAAVALLMALNPQLLHFSNEVGTEIPFLLLSLVALWLYGRREREPSLWSTLGLATILIAMTYVRSVALVMALAFVLGFVVRRWWRKTLFLTLIVGAGVAPWFVYSSRLPSTGTSVGLGRGYFALYFSRDPYGTTPASLGDLANRVLLNLRIYLHDIWPEMLFPHSSSLARVLGPIGGVFLIGFSALAMLGFLVEARKLRVAEIYVALYFVSCVGYLWAQSRLIVPIIPFILFYTLVGAHTLVRHNVRNNGKVEGLSVAILVMVLVVSALWVQVRAVNRNLRFGLGRPLEVWYARDAEWAKYLEAMEWIANNSSLSTNVMCRKADLMYIVTGHQALEYPYTADSRVLQREVRETDVRYIIEDRFTWTRTTPLYLRPALEGWQVAEPQALSLVLETDEPRTRVWRVSDVK